MEDGVPENVPSRVTVPVTLVPDVTLTLTRMEIFAISRAPSPQSPGGNFTLKGNSRRICAMFLACASEDLEAECGSASPG